MSAESPRHARSGGPLTVPSQPPSDRSIIDAVSGFINDVTLSSSSTVDPKDVIQWARFETADINEPTPEGDSDNDIPPLLLILGYGAGVQVWLIPPSGEAQEVLSWRQGTVRVLRILPTPQQGDCFASKRPLIALCDSASPGPAFCSLSFISIRGGEQVKSIKFKNQILDVLANKRSVVVSFSERFAVFDAATLEDRLAITTCYPCPCPLGNNSPINPLALGDRWLAYADRKLNPSKRSSGGCESEGVTSYTATVLHAAKSLSKGLRGLGESVAHSLAGGRSTSQSPSPPHADIQRPGVVTILDIEGNEDEDSQDCEDPCDPIVAHFIAHSEAIIALKFDPSGMLLVTADRRGHDFHVFRINPHPCGPSLASVHHLYILHRGDTTAKVQDIAISGDSRWTAISTLRGTTHVFAISPYGGACGVRTHTQPRVVNRLSRFHRSAGLPIHTGHSSSPLAACEAAAGTWYPNPRLPPYPLPCSSAPLAQLRPTHNLPTHTITRNSSGRQRLSSLSEESGAPPLLARACFGISGITGKAASVPLYLMAANGALLHLALNPRHARSVPKEKICDESPIELEVEPIAQWPLQRPPAAADLLAPLPPSNPLLQPMSCRRCADMCMSEEERWLSQVEIVTHAGPHRRLWMGPQFVFKTYNITGSNSSLSEAEAVEVDTSSARGAARSTPVNMPGVRPIVPVLIDSGSASSLEHSPSDSFRRKSLLAESGRTASVCDVQLKEDLAEAMKEDHGQPRARPEREAGGLVVRAVAPQGTVVCDAHAAAPPVTSDPDAHTRCNDDEAAFRPLLATPLPPASPLPSHVVAHSLPSSTTIPVEEPPPAAPAHPRLVTRPLPSSTTIPVQSAAPRDPSPDDEPLPLTTDVVIPAQLTTVPDPCVYAPYDIYNLYEPPLVNIANVESVQRERENANDAPQEKSLPKSTRAPDDIHPVARTRVKKSPTTKSVSDSSASDISVKSKVTEDKEIRFKKEKEPYKVKVELENKAVMSDERSRKALVINDDCNKEFQRLDEKNQPSSKTLKPDTLVFEIENIKKNECEIKIENLKKTEYEIKTEEQAWDMLLNEPEKIEKLNKDLSSLVNENKTEDLKMKSKRNRKARKTEEQQAKEDENSFVEIHTIEDKQHIPSDDLVSISTLEDVELGSSYLAKSRKQRSSKSRTPERKDNVEEPVKTNEPKHSKDMHKPSVSKPKNKMYDESFSEEIKSFNQSVVSEKDTLKETKLKETTIKGTQSTMHSESKISTSCSTKESPKSKKNNSSPKLDSRKTEKASELEEKEVYVINTQDDHFPEIQITRANKSLKKSPQMAEKKCHESDKVEKPVKSWSSIAAAKTVKGIEEKTNVGRVEKVEVEDIQDAATVLENNKKSEVSLQDKLIELCKRRDIMVAECDAPSELHFVEEHHAVIQELPPLEPLHFGLDDFKLEVMRDSLLESNDVKMTSPICKINIDDILSSIKETTTKVIESSTFNLIDMEKVPARKERGFNVVESDKITSQEVKLEDESKLEKDELEKSSDDDNASPVLSTDSDKDDKKGGDASSVNTPLSKQSKSKKSRRKKK